MDNKALLEGLAEKIRKCQACPLFEGTTNAVAGEGNPNAEICFVGEGPGFYEDKSGRPFVGRAGQLLEQTLNKIGFRRNEVFITNVVKHRPGDNRDPLPEEILACRGWLEQQLSVIKPKVVVTLGRFSMARFLTNVKISQIHGSPKRVGNYIVIPMYHPAAALRSSSMLAEFQRDFEQNKDLMHNPGSFNLVEEVIDKEDPNQIGLF
jgi:DNA polymerase